MYVSESACMKQRPLRERCSVVDSHKYYITVPRTMVPMIYSLKRGCHVYDHVDNNVFFRRVVMLAFFIQSSRKVMGVSVVFAITNVITYAGTVARIPRAVIFSSPAIIDLFDQTADF